MDLKDYLIIVLLILGINLILYGIFLDNEGDKRMSIYKKQKRELVPVPAVNMLDLQFSKDNWPSVIYGRLFTEANPFMGGYKLASKTIAPEQTGIATPPVTSPTGMLRSG